MMRLNIQRFNEGSLTGFNAHNINQVMTGVKVSYENFFRSFDNDNKNMIERMSNLWESGTAQDFFKGAYKPTMEQLINGGGSSHGLNECVRSIIDAIANAGNNWSKSLNNDDHFSNEFNPYTLDVAVDSIQKNFPDSSAGAYIDETKSESEAQLNTMRRHVEETCNALKDAVSAAAFLDTENFQHESLNTAIDRVNDSFIEAIESIRNGITNRLENETSLIRTQAQNTTFDVK